MAIVNSDLSGARSKKQISSSTGQTNNPHPSDSVVQMAATSPRSRRSGLPPCASQWRRTKKMESEAMKKASGNWTWNGNMKFSICDAENSIPKTNTAYTILEIKLPLSTRQKAKHSSNPSRFEKESHR